MKGTDGEFEVIDIYTPDGRGPELDLDVPWLMYPLSENFLHASYFLPLEFDIRYFKSGKVYDVGSKTRLHAFDQDGMIVRDTTLPTMGDMNFPFNISGMEKEALLD